MIEDLRTQGAASPHLPYIALCLALLLAGCGPCSEQPPAGMPEEGPVPTVVASKPPDPVDDRPRLSAKVAEPETLCRPVAPRLVACADEVALGSWAFEHHRPEADEALLGADLSPTDPIAIREGLAIYQGLLQSVVRRTRAHIDLWENTPPLTDAEVAWFRENPAIWELSVQIHSATGRRGADLLESAFNRYRSNREVLRHLVLRNGLLYFEDAWTAEWAARHLRIANLFDEPTVEMQQAGQTYLLARGRDGAYRYTGELAGAYRVRLNVLDRLGLPGELAPIPSYDLAGLRAGLGLDHVEVGDESNLGRAGEVVFLTGERYPGRIVRVGQAGSLLGVVGELDAVRRSVELAAPHNEVVRGLLATGFAMVREELFFDEPPNEVGQQDGIMRPAFESAYAGGQRSYLVNGVWIPVFDDAGRPHPPQVCIDFVTDVIERYAGRWWAPADAAERVRMPGRINIRDLIPIRQVAGLVEMATHQHEVAAIIPRTRSHLAPAEPSTRTCGTIATCSGWATS